MLRQYGPHFKDQREYEAWLTKEIEQAAMPPTAAFTIEEKLACIEREIAIRRRTFPGKVKTGRMSVGKALQELECMREIADDLRQQLQRERLL